MKRLPSYSPQRNVIERFWRVLRRRATHNRLFASMGVLRMTLRNNLCYFQTMRQKVLSFIGDCLKTGPEACWQVDTFSGHLTGARSPYNNIITSV